MFTYNHVVATHRPEAVETVAKRQTVGLVASHRPLETHQERVGKDLAGRGRGY